jgi:hypothetical protein
VIDFNYGSLKVPGRGSAIFLHIAPPDGGGTAGCAGIPENELVNLLRWLEPSQNPRIMIGTEDFLKTLKKQPEIREKDGFVRLDQLDSNIKIDLKYATADNFTGRAIYPSESAPKFSQICSTE